MTRITYTDFVDNYLPKNGEPGNETVFFRSPELLKRELDNLTDVVEQLINNSNIPSWLIGDTYTQNDLVVYNGLIYISLTDNNLGNTPPDAIHWKLLTFISPTGARWRAGVNYNVGDIVDWTDTDLGGHSARGTLSLWRCKVAHLSVTAPVRGSANWGYASADWQGASKFVIASNQAEPSTGVVDGDILIVYDV